MKQLIRLLRPQQWIKNVFVFSGILFSKQIFDPYIFLSVVIVAISFCLISSSVYIFNDVVDVEKDQLHPEKRNRPIASGKVSAMHAIIIAFSLMVAGLLLGLSISTTVLSILITYIIINILYTLYLKNIVILDVFCISAGFMLRILAGTKGVGIPPSKWLILCGIMITLFLGFAKRRAEINTLNNDSGDHRSVLKNYTKSFLDELIVICASGVIITYSLYTMSIDTVNIHHTQSLIYTVPFVIFGLFQYIYVLKTGKSGGDPSRDLFKNPYILCAILGWILVTIWVIKFKEIVWFIKDPL